MGAIDLRGTVKARKPFTCYRCGKVFQPPSLYFFLRVWGCRGWGKLNKICFNCERNE